MLKDFVDWLTKSEQTLNGLEPVSRLMEPLADQMESHRVNFFSDIDCVIDLFEMIKKFFFIFKEFQEDVQAKKEMALELEKKGTKLKYYCQKQDTILIKNLLVSAQHRWDKVVSRTADRTKQLEIGYNETKDVKFVFKN